MAAVKIVRKVPIGCYLSSDEAALLRGYAESLELSLPSLCRLIIQHELETGQLNQLKTRYLKKVGKEGERITARFAKKSVKLRFEQHLKTCNLQSDDAVGILFRAEPHEQWLRRAVGWVGDSPLNPPQRSGKFESGNRS